MWMWLNSLILVLLSQLPKNSITLILWMTSVGVIHVLAQVLRYSQGLLQPSLLQLNRSVDGRAIVLSQCTKPCTIPLIIGLRYNILYIKVINEIQHYSCAQIDALFPLIIVSLSKIGKFIIIITLITIIFFVRLPLKCQELVQASLCFHCSCFYSSSFILFFI